MFTQFPESDHFAVWKVVLGVTPVLTTTRTPLALAIDPPLHTATFITQRSSSASKERAAWLLRMVAPCPTNRFLI